VTESPLKFAQFPFLERILTNEAKKNPNPLTIADIACGPGEMVRYCRIPTGSNLFGMDLWDHQLRQAAERNSYAGLCRVNLVQGIPLRDCSADVMFLGEILQYLPNTHDILNDCRRILRPGGLLVVYGAITLLPGIAAGLKKWSRYVYQEKGTISADRQNDWKAAKRAVRISYFSSRSLTDEIASAGFQVTNLKAFRLFRNRLRLLKRLENSEKYRRVTQSIVEKYPALATDLLVEARKEGM
jgi:ubiquinone/menaquinone biosynthesis C-methylase UbiE